MAEPEAKAAEEKTKDKAGQDGAEEQPVGLWPKLLKAQRDAGSIEKKGENEHQHYKYVRAEDVIRTASEVLTGAGLLALIEGYEIEKAEGKTSSNKRSLEVTARGKLIIVDPDSGDRVEFPIIGTGTDSPGDKAIYKAITGGLKYAWGQVFALAFGDDPEDSSSPGAQGAADQRAAGDAAPPYGPALKDADKRFILGEAALLLTVDGPDREAAKVALAEVAEKCGGYFPLAAANALHLMANKLRELDPKLAAQEAEERKAIEEEEAETKAKEEAERADQEREQAERSEAEEAQAAAEGPDDPPPPETDDDPGKAG